jgi:hypothetical protein
MKCVDCRFSNVQRTPFPDGAAVTNVWCHFNAPTGEGDSQLWRWPIVQENDWCGQFQQATDMDAEGESGA